MARIRSIKPEFWTSEQIVECSTSARLLFIGLWNFCDDGGNHSASPKTLKMEIFPGDDISISDIQDMVNELLKNDLIVEYESGGKRYWHVTGWHHQKIDRPSYKHPKFEENSTPIQQQFDDHSTNAQRTLDDHSPPEGSGKERSLSINPNGLIVASETGNVKPLRPDKPDCPHQKIIDLYHEVLPMCPRIRDWTPARATQLRARWNEAPERQNLDYWKRFFEFVTTCDFLVGKSGNKPFFADLEWMTKAGNFAKIREGKYENREAS